MVWVRGCDLYAVSVVQDVVAVGVSVVRRDQELVLLGDVTVASVGDEILISDLVVELSIGTDFVSVRVVVWETKNGNIN